MGIVQLILLHEAILYDVLCPKLELCASLLLQCFSFLAKELLQSIVPHVTILKITQTFTNL